MTEEAPIIRRTCGNTAGPAAKRCSIFSWAAGARGRRSFWGEWEGILQTDGYQVYDDIGGPKLVQVGCWAHYPESAVIQRNPRTTAGEPP